MESKATVFVVDDDPEMRRSLTGLLEEVDLPVETYSNAREFLDAYDPASRGCLVLDVRMPGMDGISLQKTLKKKGVTLPVIVLTGHGDVPMAVGAVQRGAFGFLEKPFRAQPLLECINQALALDSETSRHREEKEAIAARVALLTPRQRQVMGLVVAGETTKTIAAALELSPKTVDHHRSQIMDKLQARSVADLVRTVQITENEPATFQNPRPAEESS